MLRSLLVAAFAMSSLAGCSGSAEIKPANTTPAADYNVNDGSFSIATGETIRVEVYGERNGFDTVLTQCEDAPTLTASVPSIVQITALPPEYVEDYGFEGFRFAFVVTGLAPGEVNLEGMCKDSQASTTIHVH